MRLDDVDWNSILGTVATGAAQVYQAKQAVKNQSALLQAQAAADQRMLTQPVYRPAAQPLSAGLPSWALPVVGVAALALVFTLMRRR